MLIANAAGFWGDWLDAPRRLVESATVDYLTLEYLAELTMSILARQREKDPQAGYAGDFVPVLSSLIAALKTQGGLRIVTNAGGVNPQACARAAALVLSEAGMSEQCIGVTSGDDLLPRLADLQKQGHQFPHLDTGQPLSKLTAEIVCANAYLGAAPIVDSLTADARIVITGRVADASLTVGPAMHTFGWSWDDYDLLAGATVAGHLIECGAQATGGFFTHSSELDLVEVGYPIAKMEADGTCEITKPTSSDGAVTRETVCEQLVYEIGDPAHYLTPDVDADFTRVQVAQGGKDRVAVHGAQGAAPPDTLKVSLAYRSGYTAGGQLLIYGRDCIAKAQSCADIVLGRLRNAGYDPDHTHVELLGTGAGVPGHAQPPQDLHEVVLRISVSDKDRATVERFTREMAPLATSGPAGLAGYTAARGTVRPVFAYWPTTISRDVIEARTEVRTAREWIADKL